MSRDFKSADELSRENDLLLAQLEEAQEILTAIRTGAVDALVVDGPNGEQVYTLEGADHLYRVFVETMNEGAVTLAANGTIVYCNKRFAELVGTQLEQTIGTPLFDLLAPRDRPELVALLARGVEGGVHGESSITQVDGTEIPVRFSARRLPTRSGDCLCMIVTDLRGKKLNEALQASEERLRAFAFELEARVEERTSELVTSQERLRALALELNRTELRERKRLAGELHDHLAQLLVLSKLKLGQSRRLAASAPAWTELLRETDEVLAEALAYTRTLVADLSPPVLHEFGLTAALEWLADQMKRHELAVTVVVDERRTIHLPEDPTVLLFQSVRELLINAAKHAGCKEARVVLTYPDDALRIEVRDRGVGFDASARNQTDRPSTPTSQFGLFSIRERMRAIGGQFEIESSQGHGTVAILTVPLTGHGPKVEWQPPEHGQQIGDRRAHAASHGPVSSAGSDTADPSFHAAQRTAIRVLLVDDHTMVRQALRRVLDDQDRFHVVGEGSDGAQAITLARELRPDVVVMDITMPRLDGIEATKVIKQEHPQMVVIGLSVHLSAGAEQSMLEAGASAYLTKEDAVEHLCQAVDTAMSERRRMADSSSTPSESSGLSAKGK